MNLLNASCLRGRYNVLPRIAIFPLLVASPLRSSSLSAIHRGIRNSEKVSAQGHSYASSSRGKTNKAKKGGKGKDKGKGAGKGKKNNKKDDGNSGKKSRKARFNDPDDPFGQNSLVFQLKNVGGKDAGKSAGGKRNPNLLTPDQFMKDFMSSPTQGKKSGTAASVPPAARPPPPSARAPPAASPPPPPPVRAPPAAASPPPPPPARAPPAAASPPPPAQPAGFWSPPPPSGGPQSAGAPKVASTSNTTTESSWGGAGNRGGGFSSFGSQSSVLSKDAFGSSAGKSADRGGGFTSFGSRGGASARDTFGSSSGRSGNRWGSDSYGSWGSAGARGGFGSSSGGYGDKGGGYPSFGSRTSGSTRDGFGSSPGRSSDRWGSDSSGSWGSAGARDGFGSSPGRYGDRGGGYPPSGSQGSAGARDGFGSSPGRSGDRGADSFGNRGPAGARDTFGSNTGASSDRGRGFTSFGSRGSAVATNTTGFSSDPLGDGGIRGGGRSVTPPPGRPTDTGRQQPSYEPSRDTPREPSHTPSWGQTIPQDDGPVRITRTTAASQFLYGRSSVEAALKRSRRKLYALYIYSGDNRQKTSQDDLVEAMAKSRGIPIKRVSSEGLRMMDKMSENRPHNGYILEVSPLPQLPVKGLGPVSTDPKKPGFGLVLNYQSPEEQEINGASEFVPSALPAGRMPFVLLLDGIQDPGNLGAIIRSAAFLGADAIAVTKGASSPITAVSVKTSAGAAEIVTLLSVVSPVEFITSSRAAGWVTYAAVSPESARSRGNSHFTLDRIESYDPLATQPTLLVLGSEGEGLTRSVRRCTDFQVSIPNHSQAPSLIDSLNVSVAAGILCSGFLRKQYLGQSTKEPEPSQLF